MSGIHRIFFHLPFVYWVSSQSRLRLKYLIEIKWKALQFNAWRNFRIFFQLLMDKKTINAVTSLWKGCPLQRDKRTLLGEDIL